MCRKEKPKNKISGLKNMIRESTLKKRKKTLVKKSALQSIKNGADIVNIGGAKKIAGKLKKKIKRSKIRRKNRMESEIDDLKHFNTSTFTTDAGGPGL